MVKKKKESSSTFTPSVKNFLACFDTMDDESGEIIARKELGKRSIIEDAKNIISGYYHSHKWDEDNTKFDEKEITITQKLESKPNITYKYHVVDLQEI